MCLYPLQMLRTTTPGPQVRGVRVATRPARVTARAAESCVSPSPLPRKLPTLSVRHPQAPWPPLTTRCTTRTILVRLEGIPPLSAPSSLPHRFFAGVIIRTASGVLGPASRAPPQHQTGCSTIRAIRSWPSLPPRSPPPLLPLRCPLGWESTGLHCTLTSMLGKSLLSHRHSM